MDSEEDLEEDDDQDLDEEESMETEGTMSTDTVRLDDARGNAAEKKKRPKKNSRSNSKGSNADDSGLRGVQWKVIHEEQVKIKKANPNMSAKEVLKKARAA